MSAITSNKELASYYQRKVDEGKNKMLVINAIRNKLLHRLWVKYLPIELGFILSNIIFFFIAKIKSLFLDNFFILLLNSFVDLISHLFIVEFLKEVLYWCGIII